MRTDTQTAEVIFEEDLFRDFYKAYSGNQRVLTGRDIAILKRLVRICQPNPYECPIKPDVALKALVKARKTGKFIRIVRDSQFWKNGSCCTQLDGWSYHLVLYTPSNTVNGIRFRKNHRTDKIWWVDNPNEIGKWEFSFDKVKIYNMYRDYPEKLTPEEKSLFDEENPYWKNYFGE